MGFQVIPAVDVAAGRLGRFTSAGPAPVDAFGGDPVAAADAFLEAGAEWVHVVDVDLALTGKPSNLDVIRRIAALGASVQASGGLAEPTHIDAVMEAGATRAVLGSAAFAYRTIAEVLIERLGPFLAVGLDADGDRIRPRGREDLELPFGDILLWLADLDVTRFVLTAVGRVGDQYGPDLIGATAVVQATGRPVIAAGGIGTLDDLLALKRVHGVEGAIVGRALYDGTLDLASALRTVWGADGPFPMVDAGPGA